jgi:hypothetical protein
LNRPDGGSPKGPPASTTSRLIPAAMALAVSLACASGALGQSVKQIGEYNDWAAYSAAGTGGTICFAMTKPTDVEPAPDGYTQAYLYLSVRPAENVHNEMNVIAGFSFAPDSAATVSVGGQTFDLFTEKDAAWLTDESRADQLAGAIRAGSTLVIEGTSDKGIRISETFSLSGATAASRAMEDTCTS